MLSYIFTGFPRIWIWLDLDSILILVSIWLDLIWIWVDFGWIWLDLAWILVHYSFHSSHSSPRRS